MSGIGEASAILGTIQFGVWLGTTLNTYIADTKEAYEDVQNLAQSLRAMCGNVKDLADLIQKDIDAERAGKPLGFTSNERTSADVCFKQATKLVEKLWKKLSRGKAKSLPAKEDLARLGASDLDFSLFNTLLWSFTKPGIEQRKAELHYLDLKIMMVKKEYRHPNATNFDRSRAAQELDSLKTSKEIALKALEQVKNERKAKKREKVLSGRRGVNFEPHPTFRDRTPSSVSSGHHYTRRNSSRSQMDGQTDRFAPYGRFGGGEGGYEADFEGTVIRDGIDREDFVNALERMLPRLQEQVRQEHEQQLALLKIEEAKVERAKNAAVDEWKSRLIHDLKSSKHRAEELKKQLQEAFADQVPSNKITKYVDEHQFQLLHEDEQKKELTELLIALGLEPATTTYDEDSSESEDDQHGTVRRGNKLFKWFGQSSSSSSSSTGRRRRRSKLVSTASSYRSDSRQPEASSPPDELETFSVLISTDGRLRQASKINLPSTWIRQYVARQEKWYRTAAFRRTLQEYSTLDHESRFVVFEEAAKAGLRPDDLVLLFAKRLDPKVTKRRKVLEAAIKFSAPWDFFHGRMFLIYRVKRNSKGPRDGDRSPLRRDYGYDGDASEFGLRDQDAPIVRSREISRNRSSQRTETFNLHPILDESYGDSPSRDPLTGSYDRKTGQPYERCFSSPEPVRRHPPTYPRVHRKHIAKETLRYYDVPYEDDPADWNYIIITKELSKDQIDELFDDTARLRFGKFSSVDSDRHEAAHRRDKAPAVNIQRDFYKQGRVSEDPRASSEPFPNRHGEAHKLAYHETGRSARSDLEPEMRQHYWPVPKVTRARSRGHGAMPVTDIRGGTNAEQPDRSRRSDSWINIEREPAKSGDHMDPWSVIDELANEAAREYRSQSRLGHTGKGSMDDYNGGQPDLHIDSYEPPRGTRSRSRSEYDSPGQGNFRPRVVESRTTNTRWHDARVADQDESRWDDMDEFIVHKRGDRGEGCDGHRLTRRPPTATSVLSRGSRKVMHDEDDDDRRSSHSFANHKPDFAQEAADEALERASHRSAFRARSPLRRKPGSGDDYPRRGILKPSPLTVAGDDEVRVREQQSPLTSDSGSGVFSDEISSDDMGGDSSSSSDDEVERGSSHSRGGTRSMLQDPSRSV
ncbi:hypothetical protein Tdes44962_MAKER04370 [Teratosphaeria destructans]|uniref:DUF8035 domain-containing protein n=1 Tax=Teratosphaeria destructans TaxID=418781 RepID=A0A9W7W000_9PEZI|nr:hypothetical protein Tdes44962_MAKER04370 [Teratosphaeria destructans]